jgi:hypothetical protein
MTPANPLQTPFGSSGQGGAYGGLDQIGTGSQQIAQSLSGIQQNIGGGGIGGGGPKFPIQQPIGDENRFMDSMKQAQPSNLGMKKGGKVKAFAKGGVISSVSKRADGIAQKGKTRCKIC